MSEFSLLKHIFQTVVDYTFIFRYSGSALCLLSIPGLMQKIPPPQILHLLC